MKAETQKKIKLTWGATLYLILNIGIIGLCVYLGNIFEFSDSIEEVVKNSAADKGILGAIFNLDTYIAYFNFIKVLSFQDSITSGIYIMGYLFNGFSFYLLIVTEITKVLKNKKTYDIDNKYGSHGTAGWAQQEEIDNLYKGNNIGWFFGSDSQEEQEYKIDESLTNDKYIFHAKENKADLNMQLFVIGPPGSNKTIGYVLPNLLHIPKAYKEKEMALPDVICIDPKGELTSMTYKYYEDLGYDIKVLDYLNLEIGDTINNLYYINKERDIWTFASNYIRTNAGKGGNDEFWVKSATNLLAAVTGFVLQKLPSNKQNMLGILETLQSENVRDFELAKEYFINEGLTGAPLFCWNNFLAAGNSPETYASILVSLATDLTLFSFKEVQEQSENNTCNIKLLGRKIRSIDEQKQIELEYLIVEKRVEKAKVRLIKYIENKAVSLMDRIEEITDTEIAERKDYEIIIESNIKQLEDELYELMMSEAQLSSSEDKKSGKKLEAVQKRIVDINAVFKKTQEYYERKSKVKKLSNKYTKKLEQAQKEVDNVKRKPMIVYILIADDDASLQPLVNVTTNTIFRQLYANARETDGVLESPVYFILEEFNNIGKIDDIQIKLGTMRSKQIFPMMIVQSLSQLKDTYEKEWENMFSQCDTKIVLGINDKFTAEYISSMLGSSTIRVQGSQDSQLHAITESYNLLTEQYQARELKKVDELITLPNENMIIIPRGLKPMLLYKARFKWWENGWKKKMAIDVNLLDKIRNSKKQG